MKTLAVLALVALTSGCALRVPPEVALTRASTTVVEGAIAIQRATNQATLAGVLPLETARTITGINIRVSQSADVLNRSLRAYRAAMDGDLKALHAADVRAALANLNAVLSEFTTLQVPASLGAQMLELVTNIRRAMQVVSADVARGL